MPGTTQSGWHGLLAAAWCPQSVLVFPESSVYLGLPVQLASAPSSGVVLAWRPQGRIFQNLPSAGPCVCTLRFRGWQAAPRWGLVQVLLPQALRAPSPHQTKQAQAKENLEARRPHGLLRGPALPLEV